MTPSFTGQPIFNPFPQYRAEIAVLSGMADSMYARLHAQPPTASDYAKLKAQALKTLRASYTVLANNFASPELMDLFNVSVVFVPYRE